MRGWEAFFTLTGTAGATLVGLMFVVITLGAEIKSSRGRDQTLTRIFVTPALMHFAIVFFAALLMLVPSPSPWLAVIALVIFGGVGLFHMAKIAIGLYSSKSASLPQFEWLWHGGLPALGYLALIGAAAEVMAQTERAPRYVAAGSTILLYCGVRNAWAVALGMIRLRKLK